MKYAIAVAAALSLTACTTPLTFISSGPPGNPNAFAYAGSPGSTYDQAANPPRILGVVAYDPQTPIAPPRGLEMPPSSSAAAMPPPPPPR